MLDRKKKLALGVAGAVVLFGMGAAAGSGGSKAEAEAQPVPTVTATATVTSPPRVETKTVEKPVTPPECLQYITLSEQGFGYAGEAMGYMSDAMKSAAALNAAGIYTAKDKVDAVTGKLNALSPQSNAAKAACRAKG